MKDPLIISTAQFEHKSGDKDYNLSIIDSLSAKAAQQGSDVIAFHECSMTGYSFARHLSKGGDAGCCRSNSDRPSIKR
jgi:predicted amidohydrolase